MAKTVRLVAHAGVGHELLDLDVEREPVMRDGAALPQQMLRHNDLLVVICLSAIDDGKFRCAAVRCITCRVSLKESYA